MTLSEQPDSERGWGPAIGHVFKRLLLMVAGYIVALLIGLFAVSVIYGVLGSLPNAPDYFVLFELAPLALGPRLEDESGNDLYVVRSGLKAGDEVAAQGSFLVDSQAQLAGTASLLFPTGAVAPGPLHAH